MRRRFNAIDRRRMNTPANLVSSQDTFLHSFVVSERCCRFNGSTILKFVAKNRELRLNASSMIRIVRISVNGVDCDFRFTDPFAYLNVDAPSEYDVERLTELRSFVHDANAVSTQQLLVSLPDEVGEIALRIDYKFEFDRESDKCSPCPFNFNDSYLYTSSLSHPESWMPCLANQIYAIRLKITPPKHFEAFSSTCLKRNREEFISTRPSRIGFVLGKFVKVTTCSLVNTVLRSVLVGNGQKELDLYAGMFERSTKASGQIYEKIVRSIFDLNSHLTGQYTEVFVPRSGQEPLGFMGLGLVDSDYLLGNREVDEDVIDLFKTRVANCFLQQYFGCFIFAAEHSHEWLEFGLVEYLSTVVNLGPTDFDRASLQAYEFNKVLVAETTNLLVNGIDVWLNRNAFRMKAHLAIRAICRVIRGNTLISLVRAMIGDGFNQNEREIRIGRMLELAQKLNAEDVQDLVEHWAYTDHIVAYRLKLKFNRRKNSLIMVLIQSKRVGERPVIEADTRGKDHIMELYGDRSCYRGLICFGIQEIDGYHIHEFYVDSRMMKFEIPCSRRPRIHGNKRMVVSEDGTEKELLRYCMFTMDEHNHQSQTKSFSDDDDDDDDEDDDGQAGDKETMCPILWVDVDPYIFSIPRFSILGDPAINRNMNALRLLYGVNVIVQHEAIDSIEHEISSYSLKEWKDLVAILKIVLKDETKSPSICARCAELICGYDGPSGLAFVRQFYWQMFGQQAQPPAATSQFLPAKNDFSNQRLYELRKLLPLAICSSRPLQYISDPTDEASGGARNEDDGLCALEAFDDVVRLIEMNDNSLNHFDDTSYLVHLVRALVRSIQPLTETPFKGTRPPPFFVSADSMARLRVSVDLDKKQRLLQLVNELNKFIPTPNSSPYSQSKLVALSTDLLSDMLLAGLASFPDFDHIQLIVLQNPQASRNVKIATFRHFCRQLAFGVRNENYSNWENVMDSLESDGALLDDIVGLIDSFRLTVVSDFSFVLKQLWTLLVMAAPYDRRFYRLLRIWIMLFGRRRAIEGHGDGLVGGAFEDKLIDLLKIDPAEIGAKITKRGKTFIRLCRDDQEKPVGLENYFEEDDQAYEELLNAESSDEGGDLSDNSEMEKCGFDEDCSNVQTID